MIDVQGSIPTRKEDQTGFRIKTGVVDTRSNRKAVDYFPCIGVHDDHFGLIATTDEQAFRLGVISQTGRNFRHPNGKALFDLQRLRIEGHHLCGVLAVDINKTVASDDRLFAITIHFHRPYNIAGRGVEGCDVVRTVVIGEHSLRSRIVVDAVGPLADFDLLDDLQRRGVEHRDLILPAIAGEAALEVRCDRDTVDSRRVRDCAHDLSVISIQDVYLGPVRNVEPPRRTVQRHVIKTADAGDRVTTYYLVVSRALQQQRGGKETV